jgi:nucleoside-diphosphate-sugar epimerase
VRALVTGGRGGIGAAILAALGAAETTVLDLPEFDVGEPRAWRSLEGEFDPPSSTPAQARASRILRS